MHKGRHLTLVSLFSLIPYILVSWAFVELDNGGSRQFWWAFGALLAARTFFGIIEMLGGILSWRLISRRYAVNDFLELFKEKNYPKRECQYGDILDYLDNISEGEYPDSVKASAKELHITLTVIEKVGFMIRLRVYSAAEAALEIYSPKVEAPVLNI